MGLSRRPRIETVRRTGRARIEPESGGRASPRVPDFACSLKILRDGAREDARPPARNPSVLHPWPAEFEFRRWCARSRGSRGCPRASMFATDSGIHPATGLLAPNSFARNRKPLLSSGRAPKDCELPSLAALLVWMLVIFTGSTNAGVRGELFPVHRPVLKWLKPDISEAAVGTIILATEKTAHWRNMRSSPRSFGAPCARMGAAKRVRGAGGRPAWPSCFPRFTRQWTEFHQSFVKPRRLRSGDVALDTAGASLGLLRAELSRDGAGLW